MHLDASYFVNAARWLFIFQIGALYWCVCVCFMLVCVCIVSMCACVCLFVYVYVGSCVYVCSFHMARYK